MRTNIEIDDALLREAMKLSSAKTKRALVELGLQTIIRLEKQGLAVRKLYGKFEFEPGYDYKKLRANRVISGQK